MKRAVLVLTIVVFALVTVIPAFAIPQDFHGIIAPGSHEMKAVIDPNDVVDPNDGIIMEETIVLEDSIIAVLRQSSLSMRKAGGDGGNY